MQPRSGGKGDRFLLVVVLNTDGDANVALLVVALDHHAYIRPDAILTHVAVDIRFNIPRDISQNRAQERRRLTMKKLKKFAALLLVGVMALALLTACGGGGGPTEEQKVLAQISQEKGVQVTNDAELRAVAERRLNESLQYKLLGYAGAYRFYKDQVGNDLAVTITARHNYENTFISRFC